MNKRRKAALLLFQALLKKPPGRAAIGSDYLIRDHDFDPVHVLGGYFYLVAVEAHQRHRMTDALKHVFAHEFRHFPLIVALAYALTVT